MIVSPHVAPRPSLPEASVAALHGGARVDACIVGAGLAGMVAAYLVAREKRSVMVVDEGPMGGLAGGAEVAHVGCRVEMPFADLERLHGVDGARIAAQGCAAAIDMLQAIVRRERIACEFERLDGFAFIAPDTSPGAIEHEVACARRAGLEGAEATLLAAGGGEPQRCIRYPGQAHFHPHKLLAGLARAITREGGRIHCGVRMRPLEPDGQVLVTAAGHRIEAQAIVSQAMREASPRIAHAVGLRIPRGSLAPALYWEAAGPARCARLRTVGTGAGEVLLAAGDEGPDALEGWAQRRFGDVGPIVQRFTCEMPRTADHFAFTGAGGAGSSAFVSASQWGSTAARAMVAGMVIRDFILGTPMPWNDLYVPAPRR